jgi:hypothetical protein
MSLKSFPFLQKKMPVVLGEVDVIKSLLLPVTNAGKELWLQRSGGGADQNLILLDEATIFNSSHVLVFLRFNPDAIKDLKLYKGGIPNFEVAFLLFWTFTKKTGAAKDST